MPANELHQAIVEALAGRRLLDHPFYRRWEEGGLAREELTSYAEQYRHIERVLPHVLEETVDRLPEGHSRTLVEENLADERGNPLAHTELFETFAAAVHAAPEVAASAATQCLIDTYRSAAAAGPIAALATIGAYEVQASEIATSKSDGLHRHYGLGNDATSFWDVHGVLEQGHARWTVDALSGLGADKDSVYAAAKSSADAWWAFLDEREEAIAS